MQNENLIEKEQKNKTKKLKLPTIDLDTKREIAKIGMTATMGITVATAFYMKNKTMKNLHVGAGFALVGFSFWHHMLYKPNKKTKNKASFELSEESSTKEIIEQQEES